MRRFIVFLLIILQATNCFAGFIGAFSNVTASNTLTDAQKASLALLSASGSTLTVAGTLSADTAVSAPAISGTTLTASATMSAPAISGTTVTASDVMNTNTMAATSMSADAMTVSTLVADGSTLAITGALAVSGAATVGGIIDAPDIEVDTISARDGTLAATVSGTSGNVALAGVLDVSGVEAATLSARDGALAATLSDSTGNVALAAVLDVTDVEADTLSARDGTLAQTLAGSTGRTTLSTKPATAGLLAADGTNVATFADGTGAATFSGETTMNGLVHLAGGADNLGFNWDSSPTATWLHTNKGIGTPNPDDMQLYLSANSFISMYGTNRGVSFRSDSFTSGSGTGPATLTYGAYFPPSAAASAPTTGVLVQVPKGATPVLKVTGASGTDPRLAIAQVGAEDGTLVADFADATGAAVFANSLQATKLGLGGAPWDYAGTVILYPNWDDGNVDVIRVEPSGSPSSNNSDKYFKLGQYDYWTEGSAKILRYSGLINALGGVNAAGKGITIPPSAAPTDPTTGVVVYVTTGSTPVLKVVGATGTTPALDIAKVATDRVTPSTTAGPLILQVLDDSYGISLRDSSDNVLAGFPGTGAASIANLECTTIAVDYMLRPEVDDPTSFPPADHLYDYVSEGTGELSVMYDDGTTVPVSTHP